MSEGVESKYVYGFDLALGTTGLVIYDLVKKEFVYIGSFNTDKVKKQKNRYHNALKLKELSEWVLQLKKMYPPYFVGIERGFSQHNNATQTIFRVHGLINFLFCGHPQEYYPPKMVKETIVNGNATKEDLVNTINTRYNYVFSNEDESDAFAVVLTVLIKHGLIEWEKPVFAEIKRMRKPKPPNKSKKKKKTEE